MTKRLRLRIAVFAVVILCSLPAWASNPTPGQADNFINLIYLDLLSRPADSNAYSTFVSLLVSGAATDQDVALTVLGSTEYRDDLTDSYYETYVDRLPDALGLQNSLNFLQGGGTDQGLQDQLLASPEFFNDQGGTNSAFVAGLYTDLLQRFASPSESSIWVNALGSNSLTTAQVAMDFLTSPEYDDDLVSGYFALFLDRVPTPSDLSLYVPEIQGGTTNEQVIAQILGSPEFFDLAQETTQQTPEPGTYGLAGLALGSLLAALGRRATLRPAALPDCPADGCGCTFAPDPTRSALPLCASPRGRRT